MKIGKFDKYMKTNRYSMSFSTGGLYRQESVRLAELYLKFADWNKVREEVVKNNLLQARTINTLSRVCSEICSRLKTLNEWELELLVKGSHQEQGYILWIAVCRRYKFIHDFAVEIMRERFLSLNYNLNYEDYDAFYNSKAEWHVELEKIASATKIKLRWLVFKILREADLLNADNKINSAFLTPRLIDIIERHSHKDFYIFPIMESELKGMVK